MNQTTRFTGRERMMTEDEVIELARQAGVNDDGYEFRFYKPEYLERFANLVAQKEREECAKLCFEEQGKQNPWSDNPYIQCGQAILGRE